MNGFTRQPYGSMPLIKSIWAYVCLDPADGNEGIVGWYMPRTRTWMPLIASDRVRLDEYKPIAQAVADETGREIKLIEFLTRRELSVIKPTERKIKS